MKGRNMTKKNEITIWKGVITGATMIVPGVSGGSMAMILGIYDRLISAISSFRKDVKGNLLFLTRFVAGTGIGMFLFSRPLSWLLGHYPMPTMYFFLGAVFGGIPVIEKKSGVRKFALDVILYMLIGVAVVLLISAIPAGIFDISSGNGFVYWFALCVMGVLAATALILPGISFSHFLLILGMYDSLLEAIKSFDLTFLIPLSVGLLVGIASFSKFLERVMEQWPKQTYLIILGFIIGSVAQIFPGIPAGWGVILCTVMAAAGFGAVYWISGKEK